MELLCLLVGLLIPVAALGLILRRGMRPLAAASAYRNVAWKLGLEADTRGLSVQGWLDGRRLYVGEAREADVTRHGAEVRAVIDLAAPLGLGLGVRRRQERRLRRLRRTPSLTVGDARLDEALEIRALDADRARALFTDDVRASLRALLEDARDLELTDHWVRVRLPRPPASADALLATVDALRRTATALETARASLPTPDAMVPWLTPWAAVADALGLRLEPALPAIVGTIGDRAVAVHAVRADVGFLADVRVGLLPHPTSGLSIAPVEAGTGRSVGGIRTGDAAFDEAFVVRGYAPGALRARLTPEVREGLLALAAHGRVRGHDAALTIEGVALDPEGLREVVQSAVRVAADLGW